MTLVPFFLKAVNCPLNKNQLSGCSPLAKGKLNGKNKDFLDIDFKAPTEINAVTLFEKGSKVTDFEIHAEIDGCFKMIYKQNRIAEFRLCAIDSVVTSKIRIKVCNTRRGRFKEISAYVYNIPPKSRDFRRTAYIVTDNYDKIDKANLKHYNKFNLIGKITMNRSGEVILPDDTFEKTLKIVREHDGNADIVATIFPNGGENPVEIFSNPETPKNIKTFLDKYDLDGVSFDWEYPKGLKQWHLFDDFVVELKKAIGDKSISLALASWIRYQFSDEAVKAIDVVEVMTYDDMARDKDGHHSEFFGGCPNAVHRFVQYGFSSEQLDIGLPFYARPVDATGYWKDYKDEVDKMDRFTNVVSGDYKDLDWKKKEITVKDRFYNSVQMIEDKTAYCIYENVGGVMVWALSCDVPDSHELCLSKAIDETCKKRIK